jgi:KRAB domain-containing zinc finger protein
VYTTENIYDCPVCNLKCKTKATRRNHMKTHTNERKYACTQCPKSFAQLALLKKHGYFHSGERPVHCEICDKGFYQKCALDIHMNVHKRQWIAEGQQGITLHTYPRNKKKFVETHSDDSE